MVAAVEGMDGGIVIVGVGDGRVVVGCFGEEAAEDEEGCCY